jgi:hypothetical protein
VSEIVILGLNVNIREIRQSHNGRVTVVLQMVGTTFAVDNEVPVNPTLCPVIHIVNDVVAEPLCAQPVVNIDPRAAATLRSKKDLLRSEVVRGVDRIISIGTVHQTVVVAGVPMKGHAVHIVSIVPAHNRLRPVVQVILIVIKSKDQHLWMILLESGAEIFVDEMALV